MPFAPSCYNRKNAAEAGVPALTAPTAKPPGMPAAGCPTTPHHLPYWNKSYHLVRCPADSFGIIGIHWRFYNDSTPDERFPCANHLIPFFWLHGEDEETLRGYLRAIHESGCGAVCVGGPGRIGFRARNGGRILTSFWTNAAPLHEALGLTRDFPSGYATARRERHSQPPDDAHRAHMDVIGPARAARSASCRTA